MGVRDDNYVRGLIQDQGYAAWEGAGFIGTLAVATGVGKSKIAVWAMIRLIKENPNARILLVVPTEKLRDENWPEEFTKWKVSKVIMPRLKAICFASLSKEKNQKYDLVVLDEIHRLTELSATGFTREDDTGATGADGLRSFFQNNLAPKVLGLTATVPDIKRDPIKYHIIKEIAPVIFKYTLDQAVQDGVVADFEIRVIEIPLERVLKEIKGGTAQHPFMQTEVSAYEWLNKKVNQALAMSKGNPAMQKNAKFKLLERTRFIANLPSKERVAHLVLQKIHFGQNKRTVVFCGGIEQSRRICGQNVFNSEDKSTGMLELFKAEKIDLLGVVNALNEGHNIPNLDQILVVQVSSNDRDIIQRIGRAIRKRPGHKAMIYILCSTGTQDASWVKKSLANLDPARIVYDSYNNYK